MGALVYVELLDNPGYRKFLHRYMNGGHVGILHFFICPLIGAARDERDGFIDIGWGSEPGTANIWLRLLISRNEIILMSRLRRFIHSLLKYAKPEMKIVDSEWGEASIKNCQSSPDSHLPLLQFNGTLSVWPCENPGEQEFDLIVAVRAYIPLRQRQVSIMQRDVRIEFNFARYLVNESRREV